MQLSVHYCFYVFLLTDSFYAPGNRHIAAQKDAQIKLAILSNNGSCYVKIYFWRKIKTVWLSYKKLALTGTLVVAFNSFDDSHSCIYQSKFLLVTCRFRDRTHNWLGFRDLRLWLRHSKYYFSLVIKSSGTELIKHIKFSFNEFP